MDAQESHLLMGNWESPSSLSFPCSHCVWGCSKWSHILGHTHTHTHTHTHKHSHLSFFSARTLPALSPLVLPLPDQYHRSGSYQAAKWPHHHKHTHTHTHTHCHRILPENEWMAIINTGWLVRPRLAAPNHQRQQRCGLCVGCIDLVMAASYAVGQC